MNKKIAAVFGLILSLLIPAVAAHATILQYDAMNNLTGAKYVWVIDTAYDVVFKDGTCADLFNGCDDSSDFIFDSSKAQVASKALLTDVFLNMGSLQFDSWPDATVGCSSAGECNALTPYASPDIQNVLTYAATNHTFEVNDTTGPANLMSFSDARAISLSGFGPGQSEYTWAVWTLSPPSDPVENTVPEPGSFALFAVGLFAAGTLGRRHKQSQA